MFALFLPSKKTEFFGMIMRKKERKNKRIENDSNKNKVLRFFIFIFFDSKETQKTKINKKMRKRAKCHSIFIRISLIFFFNSLVTRTCSRWIINMNGHRSNCEYFNVIFNSLMLKEHFPMRCTKEK